MFRILSRGSGLRWSRVTSASLGAILGMVVAMVHHARHALVGDITAENPLAHILPELVGFAAVGAFSLALVAEVRNRLGQMRHH